MSDDATRAGANPLSTELESAELRRVGRYDLMEKIGKGGMGVVYKARDSVMGRLVAVKMLVSDIDVSEEARERFYREAKSAGQLAHRNIITIYDFGEEQGRAYIVMELLEGQSLSHLLGHGERLPLEQQVEVMARTCEGLAFAHARGIVHRDVKPANLFLTTDGRVKVLDFGIARIASSKLTRSGLIVGTPDYMSPEQVAGKVVDPRSDVFSSGTVFYELLTGRRPFGHKKMPQILQNVMHLTPQALTEDEAPPLLAAIVMKALEKAPEQRHQRMVDMLMALNAFLQAWERETREIATRAWDQYRENARLLEARRTERPEAPVEEVAAAPLLRDLPMFADRGADVLKVVPFRRAKITAIVDALRVQHERLMADAGTPPPAVPSR